MATDIKVKFDDNFTADFTLVKGDLEREKGMGTAVLMSLFTDRRADESDEIDNEDKRGWWGDQVAEVEGDQIGSKIYQLSRSKATPDVEVKLKQFIFEALEWMIEDGVVVEDGITVDTFIFGPVENRRLGFKVELKQSDGQIFALAFDDLWKLTSVIGG